MAFMKNFKVLKTLYLLPAIYLLACCSPKSQSDEIILTKIDNKEILVTEFFQRIELDSQEVQNVYRHSMREYELEFYTIHNKKLAHTIKTKLDPLSELDDQMFKEVEEILCKTAERKVNFKDADNNVNDSLNF